MEVYSCFLKCKGLFKALVSSYFNKIQGIKEKSKPFKKTKKRGNKIASIYIFAESFKFDHYMSFLRPLWSLNSNRWLLLSMQYVLPSEFTPY